MSATDRPPRGGTAREIPRDDHLPGLTTLLDPERLAGIVQAGAGEDLRGIVRCSIFYVRYKPETNCVVAFSVAREP